MEKINKKTIIILSFLIILIIIALFVFKYESKNIKVKDFYKDAVEIVPNQYVIIKDSKQYRFTYFYNDNSFFITFLEKPVKEDRIKAEEDLLKILGINKKGACRLIIHEVIPWTVDKKYGGINYNLSFCPDSLPFPQ